MPASLLPSAAPPHALRCWVDDRYVYIEVPTQSGKLIHPLVEKFPLHEGGLSKALNFLRVRYEELPSREKNYTAPPVVASNKLSKVQTEEQRTHALAILRRMRIV